jgi:gamma-glutamyltranspeptidase/glutathione hydrolase
MVVTTDGYATEVGRDVLADGGNAVDAAVAVSFALAVVNPEAGNVGGGGFLLFRTADGDMHALDFRSCAPAGASRKMFLDADGQLGPGSVLGYRAAAVPGSVRGMWVAHARFGRLDWSRLIQPSIDLAHGFTVTRRFLRSFEPHIVEGLGRFPATSRIFLPGGRPPAIGTTFVQPDLARTLGRIRDQGADGFYGGETADLFVVAMERENGVLTLEDLQSYRAMWRDPVRFEYRDHVLVSMAPPSSGGITLALAFGMLARVPVGDLPWHSPEHVHLLAEAWKRAFADRNHYLADPSFVDVPVDALTSRAYTAWRAQSIEPERPTPAADVGPGLGAFPKTGHTTHYSIVDPDGNAASVTTTLNTWYGSKAVVDGTGVLLNNDMDDFTTKPGAPNFFGLIQGEANAIEPGKRMLSAMTPTMVERPDGSLRLVLGAPGGATIITSVFQVISNVLDHGMPIGRAVAAPRVHHQHLPDEIRYEPGGLEPVVVDALTASSHDVVEYHEMFGDVQALEVTGDGSLRAASDPRQDGLALGF